MPTTIRDDDAAIERVAGTLRGELVEPDDPEFNDARAIYNAMIDKHPRLIVHCVNVADVLAAVNFGREHELETAIRSGGHNGADLGTIDDGLIIDLSNLTGIPLDPESKTVVRSGQFLPREPEHHTGIMSLSRCHQQVDSSHSEKGQNPRWHPHIRQGVSRDRPRQPRCPVSASANGEWKAGLL